MALNRPVLPVLPPVLPVVVVRSNFCFFATGWSDIFRELYELYVWV